MSKLKDILSKICGFLRGRERIFGSSNSDRPDTPSDKDDFYNTTSFKVFKKPDIKEVIKTEKIDVSATTDSIDLNKEEDDAKYWWRCTITGDPTKNIDIIEGFNPEAVYKELKRRIEDNEFPVIEIPSTVMQTLQILNNPDFDYREVADLINRSPSMAGEFLKVINSSIYRRGFEVTDLRSALPRLGKANIKAMLFMYSSKLNIANHPLFNDIAVSIVNHSYAVALISSFLSQRYFPDPEMAFLAGLLHDIGKLGILKALSELYELPLTPKGTLSEYSFGNLLRDLHPDAGFFLGKNWAVNKTVLQALKHHHDFYDVAFTENSQVELHLSALVNLSDTMARILGKGIALEQGDIDIFTIPACNEINMEPDKGTIEFLENIPEIIEFKVH